MIKKIIHKLFQSVGLTISKTPKQYNYSRNDAMVEALKRFNNGKAEINSVIDIGAAAGSWSLGAKECFEKANYLLFEPLIERKAELDKLCEKNLNFQYLPKAAGNRTSTIKFKVSEDLDGSGVANGTEIDEEVREIDVVRIDEEINSHQLKGPYLIKLDTHGFEVPIIEGCEKIINQVNLFIIECYGFYLTKDSLLFWEMCQYMDNLGFKLVEIIDVFNRPKDDTFWQCDAFFVPKSFFDPADNSYL